MERKYYEKKNLSVIESLIVALAFVFKFFVENALNTFPLKEVTVVVISALCYSFFWFKTVFATEGYAPKIAGSVQLLCLLAINYGFTPIPLLCAMLMSVCIWICKRPVLTPTLIMISLFLKYFYQDIGLVFLLEALCALMIFVCGNVFVFENKTKKNKKDGNKNNSKKNNKKGKNINKNKDRIKEKTKEKAKDNGIAEEPENKLGKFEKIAAAVSLVGIIMLLCDKLYSLRYSFVLTILNSNLRQSIPTLILVAAAFVFLISEIKSRANIFEITGMLLLVIAPIPLLFLSTFYLKYMFIMMSFTLARCMFTDVAAGAAADKKAVGAAEKIQKTLQKNSSNCT